MVFVQHAKHRRHGPGRAFIGFVLSVCAFLAGAGCGAGDGSGLDQTPALAPTLTSLQANIFGPVCGQPGCHQGNAAPFGLRFESATMTLENAVNVPSAERSDLGLFRVSPGNPDASYLVWKIEGRPEIEGDRMPRNLPPLSGEDIGAIRQWIQDGASPTEP